MNTITKKRIRISSPISNSENGDACNGKKLKSKTCYVCNGNDNWVLVCNGEDCPLAIHQSCVSVEPDFDEFGSFYCPYCWYKRVLVKSFKLKEKLMVVDKSSKGLLMDKVSEDVENVVEVTSVSPSGGRREGGEELYEIFVAMEKDQRMKEVVEVSQTGADEGGEQRMKEVVEVSQTGADDVDEGREQQGRFSASLAAGTSYVSEGRKRRVICSERNHENVQVGCSDVGEGRKQERRCGVNNETAYEHGFEVGVKTSKQRIYSEKNQRVKRVIRTHKRGIFINDERSEARDSDLGEGRGGQGWCHEKKQHGKASSTESCAQEVPGTGIRESHGSELEEGRYRKKNRHCKTVVTETRGKEVSTERMREGAVERDRDESYLVENQDRLCLDDMRNDDATFNEQENGFRNEQVQRNYVSSSVSSPMSTDNVNDANAVSRELAMIIHPMAGLQRRPTQAEPIDARPPINARPYSVSLKKPTFQPEKYGQTSHLEKNGSASNDPGQRKLVSSNDRKRKRLFWTPEEEEMLRVGVEKFPGVRNIPWRKILEFGRDVFNCERVRTDLKDKWKNMNKMALDDGKRVSLPAERQPNH